MSLFCAVLFLAGQVASAARPVDEIFQFLAPCADTNKPNLGAYLWIPPGTPKIRAVMVAQHNGLPINILESAPVREVCRRRGIAQILFTPWAAEIGGVMLKDLKYDVTDPARTAVYDDYLGRLAALSEHPELVTAPIIPLAHSAFCDFPFDAAVRKPEQCLAAIPIKAGLPDVYTSYASAKVKSPDTNLCLRHVPVLFITSASQETVAWSAYPHAMSGAGLGSYRRDRDDGDGTTYAPRNELFGNCWEMMSGHFDMLPRDHRFVAEWIDAIAAARLPEETGAPLRNLTLRDGWLMNPRIPPAGELPANYAMPAPYLDYKGRRSDALWQPTERLARRQFELGRDEPRKKIELFTFLDGDGRPVSLAHNAMAVLPDPQRMLHDDGLLTLTTHHFTAPPDICTVTTKEHGKHADEAHTFTNLLFPGASTLPVSRIPCDFDAHGGAYEAVRAEAFDDERGVREYRFTLRLKRHRLSPDAGFNMSFVRVFHEGNEEFAAAGRTCQISVVPQDAAIIRTAAQQTVTFPAIADCPADTKVIPLQATSSAGLPVDYFVLKGPGVIQNGTFVPAEVPERATRPVEVTVGAYQVGRFRAVGGVKPSASVFRSFRLFPAATAKSSPR